MKLESYAENLAYYASIMLDAFSSLLYPTLYWQSRYNPACSLGRMMWNVDTMFDQEFIIYYELLVWLNKFYNYMW